MDGYFSLADVWDRGEAPVFLVAGVAELVDAADSKSASRKGVGVRVPSPVPLLISQPDLDLLAGFPDGGFGIGGGVKCLGSLAEVEVDFAVVEVVD